jgi:hypothetical protein
MNRDQFYAKMSALDAEQLRKARHREAPPW